MPKAKAAIESDKPKKSERQRESFVEELHFEVRHINYKVYDEDADLLNKVSDFSNQKSLGTNVFRAYFSKLDGIYQGNFPNDFPESLSRPSFEYALIPVPTDVWQAYQVKGKKSKSPAYDPKEASDALMLKAIELYIHKLNPVHSKKTKRSRKNLRKNNSARRWDTHFRVCFVNFKLYNADAVNANKLPNLNGFANLCTNVLRAYYFNLHNFYKHGLNPFFPIESTTETTFDYALLALPPELWDSYVDHARDHFAATGERISAEIWMLRGIEDYLAAMDV